MDELYAYSERTIRAAIAALPDGRWEADEVLEAGFFAAPPGPLHPPTELVLRLHAAYRATGLFQAR